MPQSAVHHQPEPAIIISLIRSAARPARMSSASISAWLLLLAHASGVAQDSASASIGSAPRSRNGLTSGSCPHRHAHPSGVLFSRLSLQSRRAPLSRWPPANATRSTGARFPRATMLWSGVRPNCCRYLSDGRGDWIAAFQQQAETRQVRTVFPSPCLPTGRCRPPAERLFEQGEPSRIIRSPVNLRERKRARFPRSPPPGCPVEKLLLRSTSSLPSTRHGASAARTRRARSTAAECGDGAAVGIPPCAPAARSFAGRPRCRRRNGSPLA